MTPGTLGLMTGGSKSASSSDDSIGMSKRGSKLSSVDPSAETKEPPVERAGLSSRASASLSASSP